MGVTYCDEKLYVVRCGSGSDTVKVFGPDNRQLKDIKVNGLKDPWNIVADTETKILYVADAAGCIWRVSLNGQFIKWLPRQPTSTVKPDTLSVTSHRLLVTTHDDKLLLFGSDGQELKRVSLTNMKPLHAVETTTGRIFVVHWKPQHRVSEINWSGDVINVYSGQQTLNSPYYLSFDSNDRLFVVNNGYRQILLLNSSLQLERVLLNKEHQLAQCPSRLCYIEQKGQLVVGSYVSKCVQVFIVR